MASENIITITKDNFEVEVEASELPVLVDFWAAWCGPCRMVAPVIDELAEEFMGAAKVCKINVDEAAELAVRFHVMTIPTVIAFKDGQEIGRISGFHTKEAFAALLEKPKGEETVKSEEAI